MRGANQARAELDPPTVDNLGQGGDGCPSRRRPTSDNRTPTFFGSNGREWTATPFRPGYEREPGAEGDTRRRPGATNQDAERRRGFCMSKMNRRSMRLNNCRGLYPWKEMTAKVSGASKRASARSIPRSKAVRQTPPAALERQKTSSASPTVA